MEIKTADNRMYSIVWLYDLHTKLFSNVIEGISDKDAHNRLNTKANHAAWLTGSLVQERYQLAGLLTGNELKQNADELFKDHKGIQDNVNYPALAVFKTDWEKISPILRKALVNINTSKLDTTLEMPEMKMTIYELISFTTHREAYCIGQIALWRRLMGYEAMKYM